MTLMPGSGPLSTQGERERVHHQAIWASPDETAQWVEEADEGWLVCRERVRHGYVRAKRGQRLRFVSKTRSGLYVRRELCPDCKAVELVELYELVPRRGTKNTVDDAVLVVSYPNYLIKGYLGKKGEGRKRTRDIRHAINVAGLRGLDLRDIEREMAELDARSREAVAS